jgi:pilus assembly protein CpaD
MKRSTRIIRACVVTASIVVAAACAAGPNGPEQAFDPNQRFPITVQPRMMTLRLPYNGQMALDQNMTGQLARFAEDYLEHGSGTIAVTAATRFPAAPNLVADRLLALGVGRNQIMVGNSDAPDLNDDIKITARNDAPRNFGCATQHNVAAMVADPRDLLTPETGGQSDAQRRLTVLDKYRKGESTATVKTDDQKALISNVAGGGK